MGVVVNVGRGCIGDTYLANSAGKIALILRGTCSFVEKITRASNAGAIGAIVYNDAARGDNLVSMAPVASPALVPIPGFFVGNSSGVALSAIPVTVKIQAASFKALNDAVTALLQSGILNKQQAGSLKDTISAAEQATTSGHFANAVTLMQQFEAQITSLITVEPACCRWLILTPCTMRLTISSQGWSHLSRASRFSNAPAPALPNSRRLFTRRKGSGVCGWPCRLRQNSQSSG
jgi:hypothetical protein